MIDPVDAADPAEEKRQREEEKRRARADADVLRKVMHTREGRDWLYRKLEACHIFGNPFHPGMADATAFNLGEQNVGKKLMMEAMDASPDGYMKMLGEQRDEEKRLDKIRRAEKLAESDEMGVAAHVMDLPAPEGWKG